MPISSKNSTLEIQDLQIELIQKKMKSISIRVCPPLGQIRVSAPLHYSRERILSSLQGKVSWMSKHQARFLKLRQAFSEQHEAGPGLFFLQKRYRYEFVEHPTLRGPIENEGRLIIRVKPRATDSQKELEIQRWYHEALTKHIHYFVEKWSLVLNVKVESWSIRKMKSKWGSCNVTERKITFNLELIKHALNCIEYVVAHELIHLIEPSHNARFKRFMTSAVPNWKLLRAELDERAQYQR